MKINRGLVPSINSGLSPSVVEGFTLIEILVVIAIIGSLSALLLPNYMEARLRARDAQRKSDLKAIQKALEMYKLDNDNKYPANLPSVGVGFSNSAATVYMKKIPGDPVLIDASNNPKPYMYAPDGTDNLNYELCACLENVADKDPDSATGNCSTSYTCNPSKNYKLTAP